MIDVNVPSSQGSQINLAYRAPSALLRCQFCCGYPINALATLLCNLDSVFTIVFAVASVELFPVRFILGVSLPATCIDFPPSNSSVPMGSLSVWVQSPPFGGRTRSEPQHDLREFGHHSQQGQACRKFQNALPGFQVVHGGLREGPHILLPFFHPQVPSSGIPASLTSPEGVTTTMV